MISIRYCHCRELPPGLNASVECSGHGTVVYMVPGLTRDERRAALRRLRMAARVGAGPELPAGQLALALLADRIRTVIGRAGAIFRLHPAGSALPLLLVSVGVIVFMVLSAVSIQVLPRQAAAGPAPVLAPGPTVTTGGGQVHRRPVSAVNLVRSDPHRGSAGRTRRGNGPALTGSASPAPTVAPTGQSSPASPASPATPTPTPSPSPSPSPPGTQVGACVRVGPLGVCLSL